MAKDMYFDIPVGDAPEVVFAKTMGDGPLPNWYFNVYRTPQGQVAGDSGARSPFGGAVYSASINIPWERLLEVLTAEPEDSEAWVKPKACVPGLLGTTCIELDEASSEGSGQ